MVYLTRKIEFSASHRYHNPDFSPEENARIFGKCNNPNGHGHNYVLEVTVGGETDPATGMVLDLKELKELMEREVMDRMDHRSLNHEVPELAGQIPTCENIAAAHLEIAGAQGSPRQAGPRSPVGEPRPVRRLLRRRRRVVRLELTRRYAFNAAHRLHSPHLSDAENQRVYGKCNNPYGHGHNYVAEVTVTGPLDPATGMIAHLTELDRFVAREVIEPFDHKNLNEDLPAFRDRVPTTENLCIEIFDRLKHVSRARAWCAFAWKRPVATASNTQEIPRRATMSESRKRTEELKITEGTAAANRAAWPIWSAA